MTRSGARTGRKVTADAIRALKTHGQSDAYVVDNKLPPGATTGWYSHPGSSLILVVAGTVTNYLGDDPSCTPHAYTAGAGFIDPGDGDVHMPRNKTSAPPETIAVQLLPKAAVHRIDVDSGFPVCGRLVIGSFQRDWVGTEWAVAGLVVARARWPSTRRMVSSPSCWRMRGCTTISGLGMSRPICYE